jgi:DNA ligase (NAD+)
MANPFEGKTFALTGTLERRSREEAKMSIEARGGRFASSPTKKADFVIAGAKAGAKLEKAKELGIPLLSEADFERLIDEAGPITAAQQRAYLG